MKKTLLRNLFADDSDNETHSKFIQDRIRTVEKHVPQLGNALGDYVKKSAGLRDHGDRIATILENYAKSENVTLSFKQKLAEFAEILLDLGGRRDLQIKDMESKVLEELIEYEKLCKHVRSEMKFANAAVENERLKLRQLRRIRESDPQDREQMSIAEAELLKAKGESARSCKGLDEQIDLFERKKLNGLKDVLVAWTIAELHFHAKAIQLFTEAYKVANGINVGSDLEEFRDKLRTTDSTPRLETVRETSFNRKDSIMQMISVPFQKRSATLLGTGIPHASTPNSSLSSVSRSTVSDR